jgi:cell division protein FtsA
MDTRIGYPNEHLGKSRIEAVKSPMFATTVGLVLSGYRSLDERGMRTPYEEQQPAPRAQEVPARPQATTTQPQPQPQPAQPKKPSAAGNFFRDILSRTKGLLIDDFDDKQY